MNFPCNIKIGTFKNGDPIEMLVSNEKEYEELCEIMEAEKERVRNYFEQHPY